MAKKKVAAKKAGKKKAGKKPAARAASRKKAAKPRRDKARKQAAPDPEAMMVAWQAAMTPSAAHERLAPMVGSWQARTTMTMEPGAPSEVTEGRSEHRWALGGRFLEQRYSGTSMGMPLEGIGFTGYDNAQRKYIGAWMDSFGTGIMNSVGVGRPKDDALDFDAQSVCPTGETMNFKCKLRIQGRDRHSFEMWTHAPSGKLFRMMLVEYSRAQ